MTIQWYSFLKVSRPCLLALMVNLLMVAFIPLLAHQAPPSPPPLHMVPFQMAAMKPQPLPQEIRTLKLQTMPKPIKPKTVKPPKPKPTKPLVRPVVPELALRLNPKLEMSIKVPPLPKRRAKKTAVKAPLVVETEPQPEVDEPVEMAEVFADDGLAGLKTEYELGEVDSVPRLRKKVEPFYPHSARRRGISGRVVIKCLVTEDGLPTRISIIESTPSGIFEDSVIDAVRKWRFTPGTYQGRAVATWIMAPFRFDLRG